MTDFASDMGRIVRNNIKITYANWSLVPEGTKDTVWREVKKKWNIKDDEMRGKVLSIAAERLRGWRTYMTSYYVFKTKQHRRKVPIDDPTTIYHGITKEDWAMFVRQRMDEKFQEKSRKARESQKNNLHPHYMGRTGYVGKMSQWHKEEVEEPLSSNPDADLESIQESIEKRHADRGYAWIKAHTPSLKKSSY
ncbi:hypothetical protein RND81_12G052300 [Saponaria officinalis]|uniref:Uncharacterized protein n=1 Tax=Saponaria officinalis TaxID=3572 RepID=A0AAW1H5S0_SAPOF